MAVKKNDELHEEKLRQYRKGYREGYKEGYKACVSDIKERMKANIDEAGPGGSNPRWPHIWPFG